MEDFKSLVLGRVAEANLSAFLLSQGCPFGIIDDVIQETFISVLRFSVSKMWLPPPSRIRTRARHKLIDHLRARNSQKTEALPVVLDKSDSALNAMCTAERLSLMRKAFELLPGKYRVTLELVEIDGQSYSAAAAHLEIGIETIRTRLQRGRKKLKEIYLSFNKQED